MARLHYFVRLATVGLLVALSSCASFSATTTDAGASAETAPGSTTTSAVASSANPDTSSIPNSDCEPSPDLVLEPLTGEDRRFENVEALLTGYQLEDFEEGSAPENSDGNWGGIWGDRQGGMVVAVLDCALIDVDEVARLAGPSGQLHIIEVQYTFAQIEQFKYELAEAVWSLELEKFDIRIDSTLNGREMTLQVPDVSLLGTNFAPTVPAGAYKIVESQTGYFETIGATIEVDE